MSNISEELLKIKETKAALKSILKANGLNILEDTKFSEYPKFFKRLLSNKRICNIATNISNIGNKNRNLYYSQFIDLSIKLKENYKIIVSYKNLSDKEGYVLGTESVKILAKVSDDVITEEIVSKINDNLSIYLFGYNDGISNITKDQCPIAIYSIQIFNDIGKLIFNGVPYEENGKYCIQDALTTRIYMNKGCGEDFYEYKDNIKDEHKFYTYTEILEI